MAAGRHASLRHGTLHSMSAIPHRLMSFFSCRIARKYNFGLRGISGVARRRIANNTFSLSREARITASIETGHRSNQIIFPAQSALEKRREKKERERVKEKEGKRKKEREEKRQRTEARNEKGQIQTGKEDTYATVKSVELAISS